EALIAAGMDGDTPAAVISRGSTPQQQTIAASLATLPERVRDAGISAPSSIVVGRCASRRQRLTWYEARRLRGRPIGITRPDAQADPQISRALELGAEPVLMPTIRIEPVEDPTEIDAALARLAEFDWIIVSSVNGVRALLTRLWETGGDVRRLAGVK